MPVVAEYQTIILGPYGLINPETGLFDPSYWTFPVVPQARGGRLAVFPPRQTLGPPDLDMDDTLSTANWMDLSAGIGVRLINVSTDLNKTAWSTADTRYTDGWTNAPEVTSGAPTSPSGDLQWVGRIGNSIYGMWGTDFHLYDPDTDSWGAAQTTGSFTMQSQPVMWHEKLQIPAGSDGIYTIREVSTGTIGFTHTAGAATPTFDLTDPPDSVPRPLLLGVYNQNLYALTTRGEKYAFAVCPDVDDDGVPEDGEWQWIGTDNRSTWMRVERTCTPRQLISFIDNQGGRALWCITSRGGLRYNELDAVWEQTNLWDMPPHPDWGLASIIWHPGEDLWIAAGGGDLVQYTNSNVNQPGSGPGGTGEGMPALYRGSVVGLASDFANMYALIRGDTALDNTEVIVEDSGGDDAPFYIPDANAFASLVAYNGKGWHPQWVSDGAVAAPHGPWMVSCPDADGNPVYRLFWGAGETAYSMPCRLSMYSSRQGRERGIDRFATESFIEWGEFTGGSIAKRKLFSHLGIHLSHGSTNTDGSPIEWVEYEYQTDADTGSGWHSLGIATDQFAPTVLPFGLSSDGLFSEGITAYSLKGRLWLRGQGGTSTPTVRGISLAFMPVPMDAANQVFTVVLPHDTDERTGHTREQITQRLYSLVDGEPGFLYLVYTNIVQRAYISGISEAKVIAEDAYGTLNLNIIQVKTNAPGLVGEL